VGSSLREYLLAVLKETWAIGIGVVAGIIGAIALTVTGVTIAWWEWAVIALVCLTPAQFLAYHRLRQKLASEAIQTLTTTNIQTQNNFYLRMESTPAPPVQAPAPLVQAPAPLVQAPAPLVQAPAPPVQAPAPPLNIAPPQQDADPPPTPAPQDP